MQYENLAIDVQNGICHLTISREKALNALNKVTLDELEHFFAQGFESINELKGIILAGAGEKAFVAGADIKEFLEIKGTDGQKLAERGQRIFFSIEQFHVPVIAVVNGFALGGGCELAMACHLRVATANARFGQPEVNLGIIPGYGGTQRLIQNIGKGKAMELLLTGDMIGAEEAKTLGLCNYVLPTKEEAVAQAVQILEKAASKAPNAIAHIIKTVNAYYQDGVDGFQAEVESFASVTQTEDFVEGATAFIEKRTPAFKGI